MGQAYLREFIDAALYFGEFLDPFSSLCVSPLQRVLERREVRIKLYDA